MNHNLRWCLGLFAALVIASIFYYYGVENPRWGKPSQAFIKGRAKWKKEPAIVIPKNNDNNDKINKIKILTTLLEQDRTEIRFWQDKLFTISFLFTGLILAILWYMWRKPLRSRQFSAIGCVILCFFYFSFVDFVQGAILPNDYDLIGIQFALGLSTEGEFLKGQSIYKWDENEYGPGNLNSHPHFKDLVQFNVVLTIVTAILLVFFPFQAAPAGEQQPAQKPKLPATGS